MAAENRKSDEGLNTEVKQPVEQSAGSGRSEENTCTETTTDGGRKRGRPRTTNNTGSGTETGTTQEKRVLGLATVDPDNSDTVPIPKKAKQKRTRTKKNVKNDVPFNEEQITAILTTISGVMSTSETGKIFALSEDECKQIARPLANLLAKNDSLKGLAEHSDSIALVTACCMIFLPRLFIFLSYKKQQKALKDKGVKIIKQEAKPNDKTGTISGGSEKPNGTTTATPQNSGSTVLSQLPSIM